MVRRCAAVLLLVLLLVLQQQCNLLLPAMVPPWPALDQPGRTLAGMAHRCGRSPGWTAADTLSSLLPPPLLLLLLQVRLWLHRRQLTPVWRARHPPVVPLA
jgi:hypothetical protein